MDFSFDQILIRDGKGAKDRVTMLPASLKPLLVEHLKAVKELHEKDLQAAAVEAFRARSTPSDAISSGLEAILTFGSYDRAPVNPATPELTSSSSDKNFVALFPAA